MDYIAVLNKDLDVGFSKSDLERLIGLPKNNLSGILKGEKNLSKKSKLKIEKWEASEKPNALTFVFVGEQPKSLKGNKTLKELTTVTHVLVPNQVTVSMKDAIKNMSGEKPKEEKRELTEFERIRNKKLGIK